MKRQTYLFVTIATVVLMLISGLASAATRHGTRGDDTVVGTTKADIMQGLAGDDTMRGRGGADTMYGNDGVDQMMGGIGKDDLIEVRGNRVKVLTYGPSARYCGPNGRNC